MHIGLISLVLSLGMSQLTEVRRCEDLLPLRWETRLYEVNPQSEQYPLFVQEEFATASQWEAVEGDSTGTALVARCFATPTPHSKQLIVHHYPPAPLTPTRARPVLLITGAGDQALRSMSFLAVHLSRKGFDSYALTFAHRQGDNFLQAQQIANAIELIKEIHQVDKVDVVSYSKGGVSTRIYVSNTIEADWSTQHADYQRLSTRYRGDVGRLFFMGTPHRGLDTAFRWPNSNFFPMQAEPHPDAPTSWTAYYPYGVANFYAKTDLTAQSLYPELTKAYIGQAQLLAKLDELVALPGGNATLATQLTPLVGASQATTYISQTDYYTTYYGGMGFYSESQGIEAAIDQSGNLMGKLLEEGVAPDIKIYVGAGGNPIMSIGGVYAESFKFFWGDEEAANRRRTWEDFAAGWTSSPFYSEAFQDDLPRLYAGTAFLGEVSGPSDGLLLLASATYTDALVNKGAELVEQRIFHSLNHAELIAAGQLASDFYGDEALASVFYDPNLSRKYARAENQSVEWIANHLIEAVLGVRPGNGGNNGGTMMETNGGTDGGSTMAPTAGTSGGLVGGDVVEGGSNGGTGVEPTAGSMTDPNAELGAIPPGSLGTANTTPQTGATMNASSSRFAGSCENAGGAQSLIFVFILGVLGLLRRLYSKSVHD